MYGYSCIILFLHLLIHTAWWRLLYTAETCSCYWICYNKFVCWRITSLCLELSLEWRILGPNKSAFCESFFSSS